MADERKERLNRLSERFSMGKTTSKPQSQKNVNRKRHSVYIDENLMTQIDDQFKKIQHEAYPADVTKSAFLELLLQRGLEDLDTVKTRLVAGDSA